MSMDMSDRSVRRRQVLLEALTTPKTLEQLEEELHISYHTVWRTLNPLVQEGLVSEALWRDGKKKVFVSTNSGDNSDGVVRIVTPAGSRTLGTWCDAVGVEGDAVLTNRLVTPFLDISGVLSQVWRFSQFQGDPAMSHLAGSMTPGECKPILRETLEFLRRMELAVEQMLLAEIWSDPSPRTAEKFGQVNATKAVPIGEAFERRHGRG